MLLLVRKCALGSDSSLCTCAEGCIVSYSIWIFKKAPGQVHPNEKPSRQKERPRGNRLPIVRDGPCQRCAGESGAPLYRPPDPARLGFLSQHLESYHWLVVGPSKQYAVVAPGSLPLENRGIASNGNCVGSRTHLRSRIYMSKPKQVWRHRWILPGFVSSPLEVY